MKKLIILLVFSLAINSSIFAQKSQEQKIERKVLAYIEAVESKTTITSEEKETITVLKKEHLNAIAEIGEKYEKGSDDLKAKRKESNKKYSKALSKAFGKERAKEIISASKKNKKNKKKKK